jgi:hypothetical protein
VLRVQPFFILAQNAAKSLMVAACVDLHIILRSFRIHKHINLIRFVLQVETQIQLNTVGTFMYILMCCRF